MVRYSRTFYPGGIDEPPSPDLLGGFTATELRIRRGIDRVLTAYQAKLVDHESDQPGGVLAPTPSTVQSPAGRPL